MLLANLASAEAEKMFNEWVQQTARVLKEGKLTHGGMWLSKKFYSGDEDVLNNLVLHAPALVADYKRAGGRKPDMARRRCRSILGWKQHLFWSQTPPMYPNRLHNVNTMVAKRQITDKNNYETTQKLMYQNWYVDSTSIHST